MTEETVNVCEPAVSAPVVEISIIVPGPIEFRTTSRSILFLSVSLKEIPVLKEPLYRIPVLVVI